MNNQQITKEIIKEIKIRREKMKTRQPTTYGIQ